MSRPKPSGRSYGRLTRHERNTVERMLDRNRGAREIAAELGRSPSTVTREVAAHRYVTAPRSRYGEPAPADLSGACPRLSAWPRCCNGCSHRRGYGCSRRPRVFYSARRAQEAADAELSASRSGIDETEEGAAAKLAAIVSANLKSTTFANVSRRMRQRAFASPANVLSPTAQTKLCSDRVSDPGGAGYGAKRNGGLATPIWTIPGGTAPLP